MWLLAGLGLACGPARTSQGFVRTPARAEIADKNVLLVVLDDVGVDRLASYGTHPTPAQTPTLDRLATQGTRFERAYAYATCSPTRAALLTGRYTRRTGIGFNVKFDADGGLPHDETLIPEMLRDAARPWSVAGIGKWHLTPFDRQSIDDPHAQGFTTYAGALGNLLEPQRYDDYTWYADDGTVQTHQTTYLTTREVDAAIEQVTRLPEPWFVYLSLHAPHAPFHAPPEALLRAPLPSDASVPDRYDAMLEAADRELGRLLAAVDQTDTVVVVLGDNGTPRDAARPPQRSSRAKNSYWEGGIRVPWIMAGPGVPANHTEPALVSVLDVFPTLADMAGLRPGRASAPVDGHSLWPLLLDGDRTGRESVFVERHNPTHRKSSWVVLHEGDLKLVRDGANAPVLYDLRGDSVEGRRVSTQRLEREPALATALERMTERVAQLEAELAKDPRHLARTKRR